MQLIPPKIKTKVNTSAIPKFKKINVCAVCLDECKQITNRRTLPPWEPGFISRSGEVEQWLKDPQFPVDGNSFSEAHPVVDNTCLLAEATRAFFSFLLFVKVPTLRNFWWNTGVFLSSLTSGVSLMSTNLGSPLCCRVLLLWCCSFGVSFWAGFFFVFS